MNGEKGNPRPRPADPKAMTADTSDNLVFRVVFGATRQDSVRRGVECALPSHLDRIYETDKIIIDGRPSLHERHCRNERG